MKSTRELGFLLLLLGIPTMGFLTFAVAMSFHVLARPPIATLAIGYASFAGPIPLWAGAVLLFFPRTRKLGARLALAGAFIMSVYLVLCYSRVYLDLGLLLERVLWYGVVPVSVLTLDYAAYRAYLETKEPGKDEDEARKSATAS